MTEFNEHLARLTSQVIAAYVEKNSIPAAELPALITSTYAALGKIGSRSAEAIEPASPAPAVSIKKSITPEAIICLEDGKSFKSLKRHLRTSYDMSPQEYRAKWKLPPDYPMVAPAYAERRSALAKSLGLGRKPGVVDAMPLKAKRSIKATATA